MTLRYSVAPLLEANFCVTHSLRTPRSPLYSGSLYGRSDPINSQSHEKTGHQSPVISWLGMRDSNPRMPGPKPGALPLG